MKRIECNKVCLAVEIMGVIRLAYLLCRKCFAKLNKKNICGIILSEIQTMKMLM